MKERVEKLLAELNSISQDMREQGINCNIVFKDVSLDVKVNINIQNLEEVNLSELTQTINLTK